MSGSWTQRLTLQPVAGLILALGVGCGSQPEIPTYTVERRDFVHRVTTQGNLKAAKATPVTVPQEVKRMARITWLATDGMEVMAGDVVARFDHTEMEQRLTDGNIDLQTSGHNIRKAEVEGQSQASEIETKKQVAILELDVAQRFEKTDNVVFSRVEIIESQIDGELASHRKTNASTMQGLQSSLSKTQIELLEIERRKAQIEIQQAQDGLHALEVKAPHPGILTLTRDWQGEPAQVGDQIFPGQPLGEIPDLAVMEAEVFVLEADAGGLAVGKEAVVTVEAHPEHSYSATISLVAPVAKRRFRGSPVQYFSVILSLEQTDAEIMKPGQRVVATLFLERRPQALVVPRQAVFPQRGKDRVYIKNGSGFEPREVEVGALSASLATIESGLSEGDVVALEDPQALVAEPASDPAPSADVSGHSPRLARRAASG